MRPRWCGWAALLSAVVVGGACGSSDGDDDDGTSAGTSTGTQTGTTTGTGAGSPTGADDPCQTGTTMSAEERARATCVMFVAHADWGQCSSDPSAADATTMCETQEICADCPYLWFGDDWAATAGCLGELADARCCLLPLPEPFACTPEGLTGFEDKSADHCAAEYDAYTTCLGGG